MKAVMMRAAALAFALLLALLGLMPAAYAAEGDVFVPVSIRYQLPSTDCLGQPLEPDALAALEIYVSAGPIPASDQPCPPPGEPVDEPPASFSTRIQVEPQNGTVTRELAAGVEYYMRARVQDTAGRWSNLSAQITRDLRSPPTAPTIWFIDL